MWGATESPIVSAMPTVDFNPRAPCGARPRADCEVDAFVTISIHAPRVGRDAYRVNLFRQRADFNPRAPCGARRRGCRNGCPARQFQSTRPVWGATARRHTARRCVAISIHAPRVGRDPSAALNVKSCCAFQSTRPVWGATKNLHPLDKVMRFQSTRPVWGATARAAARRVGYYISIHAPRVGRDRQNRVG